MSNPSLPGGAVNGSRYITDGILNWTQPDNIAVTATPDDVVEIRISGSDVWLVVYYGAASIDKKVAAGVTKAEFFAAAFSTFMSG